MTLALFRHVKGAISSKDCLELETMTRMPLLEEEQCHGLDREPHMDLPSLHRYYSLVLSSQKALTGLP
jgi:hypothetical protein